MSLVCSGEPDPCPWCVVESLTVLVPELLNKLKVVEDKKPINNVTTNIMRIRELIAQARSVAKKVSTLHPHQLTLHQRDRMVVPRDVSQVLEFLRVY